MAITKTQISNLLVSMFDAAGGAANLTSLEAFVANQNASYSLFDFANDLALSPLYTAQYAGMSNQAKADSLCAQFGLDKNMFGLYDTTEELAAYNFFKTQLDAGVSTQASQVNALLFLAEPANAAAYPVASATMVNKQAVADYYSASKSGTTIEDLKAVLANVTNDATTIDSAKTAIDSATVVTGKSISLTDGRDTVDGTEANDMFLGFVAQNTVKDGSIANAFATGDYIDGKGGLDEVSATVISDGTTQDGTTSVITPMTKNVEMITLQALDNAGMGVVVDAGSLNSVKEYWSDNSAADLTITDVRLGNLSITKDITFGVRDTDGKTTTNFTALFESQALKNASDTKSNAQILIEAAYEAFPTGVTSANPVKDLFVEVNFTGTKADGTIGTFKSGFLNTSTNSTDANADTYAGLATLIKSALDAQGFTNLTVELGAPYSTITTAAGVKTIATTANQIKITDPAGNAFTNLTSGAGQAASATSSDVASNIVTVDPTTSSTLIETNLVLDNAGRGSTMGNVTIGGESNSDLAPEVINIMVDRDSAISTLSTNGPLNGSVVADNELQKVVITSTMNTLKDVTSANGDLEINSIISWDDKAFTSIDASAFKGTNLMLGDTVELVGTTANIVNLNNLDANIAANVTFLGKIDGTTNGEAFTYTTGSGKDVITVDLDGDAVDTIGESFAINAGNGDNTVKVSMVGGKVSVATTQALNNLSITTGTDADKVELVGGNTGIKEVTNVTLNALLTTETYIFDNVTITSTGGHSAAQLATFISGTAVVGLASSGSLATTTITSVNTTTNVVTYTATAAGDATNLAVTGTATTASVATVATQGAISTLDGDADFNIVTGAGSDFVYINSISDTASSVGAAKGVWTVGATSTTGTDFGDHYTGVGGINGKVLYKATLKIDFAGFEQTVTINTTNANNFVATQVDINNAIIAAIKANPELSKLLTTTLGTGNQQLTINSTVEGANALAITINQPELAATASGAVVAIASADILALQKGLISTGESATSADVTAATEALSIAAVADQIDGTNNATASAVTIGADGSTVATGTTIATTTTTGANETAVSNVSTINLGAGTHDLVVLNSDVDSVNTIIFTTDWKDATNKVSVVNFEDAGAIANGDTIGDHKLDFTAFLGNQIDISANTNALSATTIATTYNATSEVVGNDVHVWNALTFTATDTFDGLTGAKLLAAIQNDAATTTNYAGITDATLDNANVTANLLTTQTTALKSIVMIENTANVGEYKVFELTANDTTHEFTAATLVGTIDFGDTVVLSAANLA